MELERYIQQYKEGMAHTREFTKYLDAKGIGEDELKNLTPKRARELFEIYESK